ncbi:type II toxin-antitoxin system RelE/ParE family toxin [Algoriphagus namhaensis]
MTNPGMGSIEVFEELSLFEYRYLIEGNHKLIYRINEDEKTIFVARVFDTRRNPDKKVV